MVAPVVATISAPGLAAGDQVPVDAEIGAPLVAPGQFLLDPGTSELAIRARADSPSMSATIALAYSCTSSGVTYTAASPADTRVSRRSNATTGSS